MVRFWRSKLFPNHVRDCVGERLLFFEIRRPFVKRNEQIRLVISRQRSWDVPI